MKTLTEFIVIAVVFALLTAVPILIPIALIWLLYSYLKCDTKKEEEG